MRIYPMLVPGYLTNSYLVSDDDRNAVIIDPGKVSNEMVFLIEQNHLRLQAVLLTSYAPEHSEGVGALGKIYRFSVHSFKDGLRGGEEITFGSLSFSVLHLPGCRLDTVGYLLDNQVLFSGDSLLSGTLAPAESYMQRALLIKSVREKIMPLADDIFLYPGRGPLSRTGLEKMYNLDLIMAEASFPSI